jgi:hypothetical protein
MTYFKKTTLKNERTWTKYQENRAQVSRELNALALARDGNRVRDLTEKERREYHTPPRKV